MDYRNFTCRHSSSLQFSEYWKIDWIEKAVAQFMTSSLGKIWIFRREIFAQDNWAVFMADHLWSTLQKYSFFLDNPPGEYNLFHNKNRNVSGEKHNQIMPWIDAISCTWQQQQAGIWKIEFHSQKDLIVTGDTI